MEVCPNCGPFSGLTQNSHPIIEGMDRRKPNFEKPSCSLWGEYVVAEEAVWGPFGCGSFSIGGMPEAQRG